MVSIHDAGEEEANVVVVVEKPFTVSTKEADQVIATAKKSGKILSVFQSKFQPGLKLSF
jgi:predicted dehydrogenase